MNFREKIEEAGKLRELAAKRAECVRALKDIDATETLSVGGEYQATAIAMGDGRAFVSGRELLIDHIHWLNGELEKMGVTVDLADDETGFEDDADDEDEEDDDSDEEAA